MMSSILLLNPLFEIPSLENHAVGDDPEFQGDSADRKIQRFPLHHLQNQQPKGTRQDD